MGIHMLDAMVHLLGPVCCATAQSHRRVLQAPIDDTTSALLEFTSGADASLTTMMATAPYWRFHLFGASGWALMRKKHYNGMGYTVILNINSLRLSTLWH